MNNYDAILQDWEMVDYSEFVILRGRIFNDSKNRFPDGTWIKTSAINLSEFEGKGSGDIVQTRNTKYLLD